MEVAKIAPKGSGSEEEVEVAQNSGSGSGSGSDTKKWKFRNTDHGGRMLRRLRVEEVKSVGVDVAEAGRVVGERYLPLVVQFDVVGMIVPALERISSG